MTGFEVLFERSPRPEVQLLSSLYAAVTPSPKHAPVRLVPTEDGGPLPEIALVPDKPVVFGRDKACHVHLEDSRVSRQHMRVHSSYDTMEQKWKWYVECLSDNGVFCNKTPVEKGMSMELNPSDSISLLEPVGVQLNPKREELVSTKFKQVGHTGWLLSNHPFGWLFVEEPTVTFDEFGTVTLRTRHSKTT